MTETIGDLSEIGVRIHRAFVLVKALNLTPGDIREFLGYCDGLDAGMPITNPTSYRENMQNIAMARRMALALQSMIEAMPAEDSTSGLVLRLMANRVREKDLLEEGQ